MRDRFAQILKIVCIGLAALLLVQLVKVAYHVNPLAGVVMPQVPSLPVDTNAPPAVAANKPPLKPGTNSATAVIDTNGPALAGSTNAASHKKAKAKGSNDVLIAGVPTATNTQTNSDVAIMPETNATEHRVVTATESNSAPVVMAVISATNATDTNLATVSPTNAAVTATNLVMTKPIAGTNLASADSGKTNSTIAKASRAKQPPTMPAMMGLPGGPGGRKPANLPPEIQARVDRVVESEILAPIMHPMPMALLGIAGKVAFLRSPSGQTGLVKEGEDLGEIKLLRIGTNRVLVEQDGQKKELMIFSGLGGESLLPKTTETSDETTKH